MKKKYIYAILFIIFMSLLLTGKWEYAGLFVLPLILYIFFPESIETPKTILNGDTPAKDMVELIGGRCIGSVDVNPKNFESILNYLKEKYKNILSSTKNKYVIFTYGPPASGKSGAVEICKKYITAAYDENPDDVNNSFIDTNVDNIVDDIGPIEYNQKIYENVKQLLIDNYSSGHYDSAIYPNMRKLGADSISELLIYFSNTINRNIIIEVASPSDEYIKMIINSLMWYKYIPIIIYPIVTKSSVLNARSQARAVTSGRLVEKNMINGRMQSMYDKYRQMFYNQNNITMISYINDERDQSLSSIRIPKDDINRNNVREFLKMFKGSLDDNEKIYKKPQDDILFT